MNTTASRAKEEINRGKRNARLAVTAAGMWREVPQPTASGGAPNACPCGGQCPRCAGRPLKVSGKGDPLEYEADRMAEQALQSPAWDPETTATREGVHIHADERAARSAAMLRAKAYTVGDHIVFGKGQYSPNTFSGKQLLTHELAHVAQQRRGAPLQIQRQESGVSVRSPTLELWALRNQRFLAWGGVPLLPHQRLIAKSIFHSSLNCDVVRIVHSPLIAAPTTFGNTIRVPPAYAIPDYTLIHELTHVWQYQTMGSGYISDSVFHQGAAVLTSLVTRGTLDRSGAYNYVIVPGKSFYDYTAEQQAMIVENYFLDPTLRKNTEYQRLISQVRSARPLHVTQAFREEQAAGLAPRQQALPQQSVPFGAEGAQVPQLEFRF